MRSFEKCLRNRKANFVDMEQRVGRIVSDHCHESGKQSFTISLTFRNPRCNWTPNSKVPRFYSITTLNRRLHSWIDSQTLAKCFTHQMRYSKSTKSVGCFGYSRICKRNIFLTSLRHFGRWEKERFPAARYNLWVAEFPGNWKKYWKIFKWIKVIFLNTKTCRELNCMIFKIFQNLIFIRFL